MKTILAVDPGGTNGVAKLWLSEGSHGFKLEKTQEAYGVKWAGDDLHNLWDEVTLLAGELDPVLVVEEFRLYPWMARTQGFSTFETCEVIGVLKYLAELNDIPIYMQKATIKKEARSIAEDTGWEMKVRSLGSGKGKYRGPDFAFPTGPQHPRDALAHGVYWAYRNKNSPAYRKDEEE